MKVLITGICGFVGSSLARRIEEANPGSEVFGIDNLMRPGSETNRRLSKYGVRVYHGDVRSATDIEALPSADWVIDAAANPRVLAGLKSGTRQLLEHNLFGTVNILEYCRKHGARIILLSTTRVYSVCALSEVPMEIEGNRFKPRFSEVQLPGISANGIADDFSTAAPVSLYGATKLASEALALEYGEAFGFRVWINRCSVLAGAGQFGTVEQGIFSFWLHAWRAERPLQYIGFGGTGFQVRDAFHPDDLADLVLKQIHYSASDRARICNVGGGLGNSMSLCELSNWCSYRFGDRKVTAGKRERPFDIPWMVLDTTRVKECWGWKPSRSLVAILSEIADHAEQNPNWLELTTG